MSSGVTELDHIYLAPVVPVEQTTWGYVKEMYRN